jgi:hypothetical protein
MKTRSVPVTITPEAAAQVAKWGRQAELEQMLDQVVETIPQLVKIDVELGMAEDATVDDPVLLEPTTTVPWQQGVELAKAWGSWKGDNFPSEVRQNFVLLPLFEGPDDEG